MRELREKKKKENAISLMQIIGLHTQKYWIMGIVFLSMISLIDVVFILAWYFSEEVVPLENEIAFYVAQGILLAASLNNIFILLANRKGKISPKRLAVSYQIYDAILMVWGTIAFLFDLTLGFAPIVYLMICTLIAGLFVVEPHFFAFVATSSIIAISIRVALAPELLFGGDRLVENMINVISFILLIIVIGYRNFHITIGEYRNAEALRKLSYVDQLTGLGNERSYVEEVDRINQNIDAGEEVEFAVVLMDVNNLKATNDAYGHRYGCSLVVRCGHTLPSIFPHSKCFHVGGDEFLALVTNEDYEDFEETMKRYDEKMLYSIVEYEGKELIFSVARGFAKREKGQHFKDVLQIADDAMYRNKKALKEKYNMKGR